MLADAHISSLGYLWGTLQKIKSVISFSFVPFSNAYFEFSTFPPGCVYKCRAETYF